MKDSNIEWTDHTFNPWEGCTKVSPGCANCYAEARNQRFSAGANWGKGAPRRRTKTWREPVKWNREAQRQFDSWNTFRDSLGTTNEKMVANGHEPFRRPRVFCASLADWLDDEVPIEWLADLLKLIHDTPNLDWLLLSKRPGNFQKRILHAGMEMMGYVDGQKSSRPEAFPTVTENLIESVLGWSKLETHPPNVWIGTTVEDQKRADERIPELLKIPARVRFLSCEPLLERVDLHEAICGNKQQTTFNAIANGIHWVIAGGESGQKKRAFNPDWARSLRDQCAGAGVAFFMKQIDKVQPIPADLMVRQFPSPQPVYV